MQMSYVASKPVSCSIPSCLLTPCRSHAIIAICLLLRWNCVVDEVPSRPVLSLPGKFCTLLEMRCPSRRCRRLSFVSLRENKCEQGTDTTTDISSNILHRIIRISVIETMENCNVVTLWWLLKTGRRKVIIHDWKFTV